MKKVICLLLILTLSIGCLMVSHAENMVGGWTIPEDNKVTEEAAAALEKAQEEIPGAKLVPVALLGSQVVAGVNYVFLCKTPGEADHYDVVHVWAKPDGTALITGDQVIGIGDVAPDRPHFEVNALLMNEKGEVTGLRGRYFIIGSDADGIESAFYQDGECDIPLAAGCTFAMLNDDLDPEPTENFTEWVIQTQLFGKAPEKAGNIEGLGFSVELTSNEQGEAVNVTGFYTPWG